VSANVTERDAWMSLVDAWLASTKLKENSKNLYRSSLRAWHKWCLEQGVDVCAATHQHAAQFLQELEKRTTADTALRYHTSLNGIYVWLVAAGKVDVNPVAEVARARKRLRGSLPALGLTELQHIWAACPDDFARVTFGLNAFGPLRAEELCSLRIEDITTREGRPVLRLRQRSRRVTNASDWMALPPPLHEALIRYTANRQRGPIIANKHGRAHTPNSLWRLYNRIAKASGLSFQLTTDAVFDASRLLAMQQNFPFAPLVRSIGEPHKETLALYLSGVAERYGDQASLRLANLIVGYESQSHRLASDAERLLHDDKMLPLAAGALAGAALERHLRLLCQMHRLPTGSPGRLTGYADALFKAKKIDRDEFHDLQGAAYWRDDAAHGWTDRHSAEDADKLVTLLKRIADDYPLDADVAVQ
jgi:integrase